MRLPFVALLPAALLAFVPISVLAATPKAPGVPNFHQVDGQIYRGGQPDAQGWKSLANLGVKTVVDLCDGDSPANEKRAVAAAGMKFINVPMSGDGVVAPSAAKVQRALLLIENAKGAIFVHCHKGSDRTGTVVAVYRITDDHWGPKKALKEAKSDGMSWMNIGMKRYISHYTPAPAPVKAVAAATAALSSSSF